MPRGVLAADVTTPVDASIVTPVVAPEIVKVTVPVPPLAESAEEFAVVPKLLEIFDPPVSARALLTVNVTVLEVSLALTPFLALVTKTRKRSPDADVEIEVSVSVEVVAPEIPEPFDRSAKAAPPSLERCH